MKTILSNCATMITVPHQTPVLIWRKHGKVDAIRSNSRHQPQHPRTNICFLLGLFYILQTSSAFSFNAPHAPSFVSRKGGGQRYVAQENVAEQEDVAHVKIEIQDELEEDIPFDPCVFDVRRQWRKTMAEPETDFWDTIISQSAQEAKAATGEIEAMVEEIANGVQRTENFKPGEWLQSIVTDIIPNGVSNTFSKGEQDENSLDKFLRTMGESFLRLMQGKISADEIIASVRGSENNVGEVEDRVSFAEIFGIINDYKGVVFEVLNKYLGGMEVGKINPSALFYYLEHEDERKNSSWKRRVHRFYPGVELETIEHLYDDLALAWLAYADNVNDIRLALHAFRTPSELVYCEKVSSEPAKPSHFIALRHDQGPFGDTDTLEAILVVRGTKTVADIVTDLCCDDEEYEGGRAHSFMLRSGQYLVDKHTETLQELCKMAGKSRVNIRLIGHSMGAGAAAIAGIEFNRIKNFKATVTGFGTPAIVSEELAAETASFITTVVADSDIVPRASAITVANLVMDMMEFDWVPRAHRDVRQALQELHRRQPVVFSNSTIQKLEDLVLPLIRSGVSESKEVLKKTERLKPLLYPPGKCMHLYHDGFHISGRFVPGTFFNEIDFNRRMMHDHIFFSGYEKILLDAIRHQKRDHNFRFDVGFREILPE